MSRNVKFNNHSCTIKAGLVLIAQQGNSRAINAQLYLCISRATSKKHE